MVTKTEHTAHIRTTKVKRKYCTHTGEEDKEIYCMTGPSNLPLFNIYLISF